MSGSQGATFGGEWTEVLEFSGSQVIKPGLSYRRKQLHGKPNLTASDQGHKVL